MSERWPQAGPTAGTALLLAVVLAGAALAGMMVAMVGSMAGTRAIYYAAVFGLITIAALVAMTRREPVRFAYLALILCFPLASAAVPPGRFDLSVTDVAMVLLAVGVLWNRVTRSPASQVPLFPSPVLMFAWLLAIPCIAFSLFPALSLKMAVITFGLYAFLLLTLEELRRKGGFERLVALLAVVAIVMAAGCFVERVLHVNLSLRGDNLNQLSYGASGFEIYRAGGFFQDPQKAATWLACMIAFLLVLAVRGRFRDPKLSFLVWTAIVLASGALVTTVSRAAIAACVVVSLLALFAFNRWNAALKLLLVAGVIVAAVAVALTPIDAWLSFLPRSLAERLQSPGEDFDIRVKIWFDTWNMFADHPLTGVGFGGFRDYLIMTQPAAFNYYGLGDMAGVSYIPDNPESGYFKILYEGGILGSLSVGIVALAALKRGLGIIAGANVDPHARTEAIAALGALLVFATTFIALFTIGDGRIAALVAFFLGVIWHRSLERAAQRARRPATRAGTGQWNRR